MEVLILVCLILLNGAFAMSEVALLTARQSRLATLAQRGDKLAAAAIKLSANPTRFLSTVQIGITAIGILNGIVGEAILAEPFAIWLQLHGLEPKTANITATLIVVVVITYVTIVVGEIVPKRLGQHSAENISRFVAWPMRVLAWVTAPFVHLLTISTDAVLGLALRLLRLQPQESGPQPLSIDEIRTIVLESSNVLPKKHATVLLNLLELGAITVDDVMVPRNQIEAVNLDLPLEELAQQISTAHHRRVVVYQDQLDNVIGTLRVRHALTLIQREELTHDSLREMIREPYFVPSATPLLAQIQHFQEHEDRVSLVVDEYGEIMGLVTLDDILEEIIGEFTTQSPLMGRGLHPQPDGSYVIEGGTLLRELNRKLGFNFPLDGPKTLNGLILEHLQDIPEPNTSVRIAGHPLEIVQTQDRVIKSVRVYAPTRT
ncbi:MAG: CNNM domain-containing protein [Burkholderiales bacterium]|jgi:Mg2+/Co2+ transporter CorB|nr:CNNM domain-containing protein [Burkholderiales bacterium]